MSRPGFPRFAVLLSAEERKEKKFHKFLALRITLKNSARKWNQRCIYPSFSEAISLSSVREVTTRGCMKSRLKAKQSLDSYFAFFLSEAPARFWVFRSIYDPQWML
jgi:peptide methionine sulfoxide reductase MsrB